MVTMIIILVCVVTINVSHSWTFLFYSQERGGAKPSFARALKAQDLQIRQRKKGPLPVSFPREVSRGDIHAGESKPLPTSEIAEAQQRAVTIAK